ncbi:hypothetical protein SAMN05428988_5704 [Chitinophaga sp. YR573]|uniref:hypothetical protein n=1 Tax=Chitinophaga sp. YR573 TaxID=1881040 RepID=UPI0008C557B9|nr:hypothetical protein [Chitinophaga sp. YR573]SEW44120.1 hypothetical protein SAMN05428988_5704 [Chitinophaga sp. YR573]
MFKLFISRQQKMPPGLTEEVDSLQQQWDNILRQLEEQYLEIVKNRQGNHEKWKGQLNGIIKKARDAYQSKSLNQYNILIEKYKEHQPACDLLSDCRDEIYHTLLEWENRLIPLQKHNITQCAYC